MSDSLITYLETQLKSQKAKKLERKTYPRTGKQQAELSYPEGLLLNFCSNDYLGLAQHPALQQTLNTASLAAGVGAGAGHLINGHHAFHETLEHRLAAYTQRPAALLFSTGYMANLGVISSLLNRQDSVFLDRLNHASLIDAAILSRAKLQRYPHLDLNTLEKQLANSTARYKLIATDSVFSMDGDIAPLAELADLARQYDAWLMVDDAHGLGVLGQQGRGSIVQAGLSTQSVPILMGTLGKALGCFGAFVAGEQQLIDHLRQQARSYIYTTALPPALAASTTKAIDLAEAADDRRAHLQALIQYFRTQAQKKGWQLSASPFSPVQPIIIGDTAASLIASQCLRKQAIQVIAIRPPTVPEGTARLRVSLTADHSFAQLECLLDGLSHCL